MVWVTSILVLAASAGEWRAALGGEINADSHGVIDLGYRSGAWSVELLTDTVDARYSPGFDKGRAWFSARAQGGTPGLISSPWVDGAPAPEQALFGWYAGGEAGGVRYLPRGFYAGAQGGVRYIDYLPTDQTVIAVPRGGPWAYADGLVGYWSESLDGYARLGADWLEGRTSPHVQGQLRWVPKSKAVMPLVELRAGWASNTSFINKSRLGGLNPYVVPLAGAAWAEFWVENYAAARLGPVLRAGGHTLLAGADVAWFDGETGWGALLSERYQPDRFFVELQGGFAPDLPRQSGVAWSSWVRFGLDWGPKTAE